MTILQATQQLVAQLIPLYEKREAVNIADLVMENISGWTRLNRLVNKQFVLEPAQWKQLELYTAQLLAYRPVQYVLGETWFYGMKLHVDENVLIPRPETEELVQWAAADAGKNREENIRLIDVGTGSGCIALALKKELPYATVYACDISPGALQLAEKNALSNGLSLNLLQVDFLQQELRENLPLVDMVISNPPYIPFADKAAMHLNVLDYEPHLALFVKDDDPLIFYMAIAGFASSRLRPGGTVYMEIHEGMAARVTDLFQTSGFMNLTCKKDLQGKDRMIRIIKG